MKIKNKKIIESGAFQWSGGDANRLFFFLLGLTSSYVSNERDARSTDIQVLNKNVEKKPGQGGISVSPILTTL